MLDALHIEDCPTPAAAAEPEVGPAAPRKRWTPQRIFPLGPAELRRLQDQLAEIRRG